MTPRAKTILKNTGIFIAAVVISLGLFLVWALWEREPSEMLNRVDSLEIPSGWTMTDEKVTGKINFCLEKAGCPSMYRKYQLGRRYEADEMLAIFGAASIDADINNVECEASPLSSGTSVGLCSVTAQDDSYRYRLFQDTNNERTNYSASLFVSKR